MPYTWNFSSSWPQYMTKTLYHYIFCFVQTIFQFNIPYAFLVFFPINRILSVFLGHFSMAIASNDDKHFRIYEVYFDTYSRTSRQKSNQIYLSCSMFYLLEGFSKESYRRGHLSVGWSLHNNTSLFERPLVGNRTTWILPGCLKFPLIKT